MYLIEANERLLLLGLLSFNILTISLYVNLLNKSQRNLNFLHPGWLLLVTLLLYGQITPIFVIYAEVKNVSNNLFLKLFVFEDFIIIYLVYTGFMILILIAEIFIYFTLYKKIKNEKNKTLNLAKKLSITITGFIILTIGFLVFLRDYNNIININPLLIFDKVQRIETSETSSLLSFTNLYVISFIFLFLSYFTINNKKLENIIIFLFLISSTLVIYMGTTMQVLFMIIAYIYLGFYFKKFTLKKIFRSSLLIIPIFLLIMSVSEQYREYQLNLINSISVFSLPDLSTFESITGYISGFILLNSESIIENYNFIDFIIGLFPKSILNFLNTDYTSMTVLIRDSYVASSYGTYVPTLPISVIPYIGVAFIVIPILYIIIFFTTKFLATYNLSTLLISTLFYIDLFYIIRINTEDWIAKFRFDLFLILICILIYKIIELFLNNYIDQRRITK